MVFLSGIAVFFNVYFIFLQTYTLSVEVMLHAISWGFSSIEGILGLICFCIFYGLDKKMAAEEAARP